MSKRDKNKTLEAAIQPLPGLGGGSVFNPLPKQGGGVEVEKHTKIAIHTVSQFYGDNKQLSLFSDEKINAFKDATGMYLFTYSDKYVRHQELKKGKNLNL